MATKDLYDAWLDLTKHVKRVQVGKGDEIAIGNAIGAFVAAGGPPDMAAAFVESAGASALYSASKCKECAGHARQIARMTLADYLPAETKPAKPAPKPKPRKGKGKGAAPSHPAAGKPCPACDSDYLDDGGRCPHCGYPFRDRGPGA